MIIELGSVKAMTHGIGTGDFELEGTECISKVASQFTSPTC